MSLVSQSSKGNVTINFSMSQFTFDPVSYKGEEMSHISVSGIMLPNDEGMPDLPCYSRYVAVPDGAKVKVVVKRKQSEKFENVNVAPALRIQAEIEEPSFEYKKNKEVYSTISARSCLCLRNETDTRR